MSALNSRHVDNAGFKGFNAFYVSAICSRRMWLKARTDSMQRLWRTRFICMFLKPEKSVYLQHDKSSAKPLAPTSPVFDLLYGDTRPFQIRNGSSKTQKSPCSLSTSYCKVGGKMIQASLPSMLYTGATRTLMTSACKEEKWVHPDGRSVTIDLTSEEKKRRAIDKIKYLRRRTEFRRRHLSPEGKLLWKLEVTKMKLAMQKQRLRKYQITPDVESEHDPEIITTEQLQALKKIGYMNKNYVPVGVRGIYAGTIENMHMHWKFHETCQVDLHVFPKIKIREMAKELARLSGGIVIDIHRATTVIMYRGKNYKQPKVLLPENLLDKRKALFKSRFTQSKEMIEANIEKLTARLEKLRQESDIAGLVEKMAFANAPNSKRHKFISGPDVKDPVEYGDYTEDEFDSKDEKLDTDEILVGGDASTDDFETDEDIDISDSDEEKL